MEKQNLNKKQNLVIKSNRNAQLLRLSLANVDFRLGMITESRLNEIEISVLKNLEYLPNTK